MRGGAERAKEAGELLAEERCAVGPSSGTFRIQGTTEEKA